MNIARIFLCGQSQYVGNKSYGRRPLPAGAQLVHRGAIFFPRVRRDEFHIRRIRVVLREIYVLSRFAVAEGERRVVCIKYFDSGQDVIAEAETRRNLESRSKTQFGEEPQILRLGHGND